MQIADSARKKIGLSRRAWGFQIIRFGVLLMEAAHRVCPGTKRERSVEPLSFIPETTWRGLMCQVAESSIWDQGDGAPRRSAPRRALWSSAAKSASRMGAKC